MKIEYTPTHHRREHNASETTQVPFLAMFKATRNKLGQKRHYWTNNEREQSTRSTPIKELLQKHAIHSRKETPPKYGFSQLTFQDN